MRISILACCFVPLVVAGPAVGQLAPTYSGQSTAPVQGTQDEFYWSLNELGLCLAKTRKREARAFVLSESGSADENRAFSAMLGKHSMCVRGASSIRLPTSMIRGAIAEAMYKKGNATFRPPVAPGPRRTLTAAEKARLTPYGVLSDFSRCLAAAHPQETHALITTTRLGSKAEAAQIDAMAPRFDACLPVKFRIAFDPSEIRLGLAEAMLRATLPIAAQTAGKAR